MLNKGELTLILESIEDLKLRDFLSKTLEESPEQRIKLEELIRHPFLEKGENDHNII